MIHFSLIKENDLLNSQIFNSNNNNNNSNNIKNNINSSYNNKISNTIRNNYNENEITNGNQYNISSQTSVKQEIPIRNSQVGLSGSQNNNYRRARPTPLNNRYPNSSYKRSNSQTSKCKLI